MRLAEFTGAELRKRVRRLHTKYESYKGRFLLSVTLENRDGNTIFFRRGGKHFELRDRRLKTFRVLEATPKLGYERWTIFEHPPDSRRIIRNEWLASFQKQKLLFLVSSIKLTDRDPFTLTLRNVVAQGVGGTMDGINVGQRQLSCAYFRDIVVPAMTFSVYPARVKVPQPPDGFEELLREL